MDKLIRAHENSDWRHLRIAVPDQFIVLEYQKSLIWSGDDQPIELGVV